MAVVPVSVASRTHQNCDCKTISRNSKIINRYRKIIKSAYIEIISRFSERISRYREIKKMYVYIAIYMY